MNKDNERRGASLVEILAALSIIAVMGSIVLAAFGEFRSRKTMDAAVELALSAFSRAHLDTISSKNDKQYGVHIEASKVVYFVGPTYSAAATTNANYLLPSGVEIANISLGGGGSNVLYDRLKGGTSNNGTFDVRVKARTTIKTTITISATGSTST